VCDDVHATVAELKAKGVDVPRPISDEGFGLVTAIRLPGGGELGLYQPRHPTPLSPDLSTPRGKRAVVLLGKGNRYGCA
jgi:hypothetical protein